MPHLLHRRVCSQCEIAQTGDRKFARVMNELNDSHVPYQREIWMISLHCRGQSLYSHEPETPPLPAAAFGRRNVNKQKTIRFHAKKPCAIQPNHGAMLPCSQILSREM
jgi:hypothetical protein